MGITAYFTNVLLAPPKGRQWPWGAVDPACKRVFLQLWDEGGDYSPGNKIIVLHKLSDAAAGNRNLGWRERRAHLSLTSHEFYGVLCKHSNNPNPKAARIGSFDREHLLVLDDHFIEENGNLFAMVRNVISVAELYDLPERRLSADVKEISSAGLSTTEREALIQARVGQGLFRNRLLKRHGNACAVTGCKIKEILRASHIKPWRESDNTERLDVDNGLLLIPTVDALFDQGFITFHRKTGKVIVSPTLDEESIVDVRALGGLKVSPTELQGKYLDWHKVHILKT